MSDRPASAAHAVSPHLVCTGAAAAIEFYREAFGATCSIRVPGPDGRLIHACVEIQGAPVMLVDEHPEMGSVSPTSLGGTPVTIHLVVPDADKVVDRAVTAGAKLVMPVEEMFWGDRYGVVEDPFGHRWSVATPVRQLGEEEIQAAARAAFQS